MKNIPLTLLLLLTVSACGLPGPILPTATPRPTHEFAPIATFTPVCISAEPTQADIDRALSFGDSSFDTVEWERSYTVSTNKVAVTWLNNSQDAVAYLEALIFPCGYEEGDVDDYFSDENWKIIFQNYESYESTADMCRTHNGLRRYEFSAVSSGNNYDIQYFVKNDTNNRVISLMLVAPSTDQTLISEYTSRLFPGPLICS